MDNLNEISAQINIVTTQVSDAQKELIQSGITHSKLKMSVTLLTMELKKLKLLKAQITSELKEQKEQKEQIRNQEPKRPPGRPRLDPDKLAPSTKAFYAKLARASERAVEAVKVEEQKSKNNYEKFIEKYEGLDEENWKLLNSYMSTHSIYESRAYFKDDLRNGQLRNRIMECQAMLTIWTGEHGLPNKYNESMNGPRVLWLSKQESLVQIVSAFNKLLDIPATSITASPSTSIPAPATPPAIQLPNLIIAPPPPGYVEDYLRDYGNNTQ